MLPQLFSWQWVPTAVMKLPFVPRPTFWGSLVSSSRNVQVWVEKSSSVSFINIGIMWTLQLGPSSSAHTPSWPICMKNVVLLWLLCLPRVRIVLMSKYSNAVRSMPQWGKRSVPRRWKICCVKCPPLRISVEVPWSWDCSRLRVKIVPRWPRPQLLVRWSSSGQCLMPRWWMRGWLLLMRMSRMTMSRKSQNWKMRWVPRRQKMRNLLPWRQTLLSWVFPRI